MKNKKRNAEQFSEIYTTYFPKLLRFSRFYILSEEEAENIIQDMFTDIWDNMKVLQSIKNTKAFLFSAVKNRCIDYLRKQALINNKSYNLLEISGKEIEFKLFSLLQIDENMLSADDVENLLHAAIEKLPKRCREIFILSRMEGLKNREIAEQLEISTSTVENQMTIAIRKLKSELKDFLPFILFFL